jgi:hypothetical protein
MDAGRIARQPVEPLARLLLGAVTEAAVAVSAGPDIGKVGTDYARAFRSLLDALNRRLGKATGSRERAPDDRLAVPTTHRAPPR